MGLVIMETFIDNEIPGYMIGFMLMICAGYDGCLMVGVGNGLMMKTEQQTGTSSSRMRGSHDYENVH
jgi:hypothetical protein